MGALVCSKYLGAYRFSVLREMAARPAVSFARQICTNMLRVASTAARNAAGVLLDVYEKTLGHLERSWARVLACSIAWRWSWGIPKFCCFFVVVITS